MFVPHPLLPPPRPIPVDVEVSFDSMNKRRNSSKANDPIRTVLKYFDSRDADLGGPVVPVIRFRVQKITDKLNLGLGETACRIKLWGTGAFESVIPCVTPPFLVKSKNPKVRGEVASGATPSGATLPTIDSR